MKLTATQVDLPLKHTFSIARESITTQPSVIVELEHDGIRGFGEVTENAYYGHTYVSIVNSLRRLQPKFLNRYATESPLDLWSTAREECGGDMFALAALDMAAHDYRGKQLGIRTWQDWGLQWKEIPQSSFTIGIDTTDKMVAKLQEEPGWSTYKIKLGTSKDIEIVAELRRHTDAVLRVDANCGWSVDETLENSRLLADLGVEFLEQPLPAGAPCDSKRRVFEKSALPVVADEDCQVTADIGRCSGLFHGVNVKICKCGGLSPALEMLVSARSLGLKTMVGCMVETSVGISGAAQLLPLLDYADLDGAVLLADDPCSGVSVERGQVTLADRFGCGSEVDYESLQEFSPITKVICSG